MGTTDAQAVDIGGYGARERPKAGTVIAPNGANLDRLSSSERRLALEALGAQVQVYSNQADDTNEDAHLRWTMMLGSTR